MRNRSSEIIPIFQIKQLTSSHNQNVYNLPRTRILTLICLILTPNCKILL